MERAAKTRCPFLLKDGAMQDINMTWTGVIIIFVGVVLLVWEVIVFVKRKLRALISTWMQTFWFHSPHCEDSSIPEWPTNC